MSRRTFDAEVAIIGAGAAGLTVARELQARGRSFVLLEASHRIGGRAYTEYIAPGVAFDLGAHWIHSPETNPFVAFAADCGAMLREEDPADYTADACLEDGAWLPEKALDECEDYMDRQFAALEEAAAASDELSVFDVIDNESRWSPYFYLFFGQDYTSDVDGVSARDAMSTSFLGNDHAVVDGFGYLVARYGKTVPVSLNSAVTKIDWSGPGVKLVTARGIVSVEKLVLTVSTGVLAAQQIEFQPRLPDWKLEAIAGLQMGSCTRACLVISDGLLANLPEDFTVKVGDDEPLHFRNRPFGQDYVEVTTGGRLARWMEKSGERATIDYVTERLKHAFGSESRLSVSKSIVSAWDGDVWTRGSYSSAVPGAAHQRRHFAAPIDGRLYFAGEAAAVGHYATVHGACFSGRDAAAAV